MRRGVKYARTHFFVCVSLLVCSACVSRRGECVITGLVSTILHLRRAGSCYYSITDIITAEELRLHGSFAAANIIMFAQKMHATSILHLY